MEGIILSLKIYFSSDSVWQKKNCGAFLARAGYRTRWTGLTRGNRVWASLGVWVTIPPRHVPAHDYSSQTKSAIAHSWTARKTHAPLSIVRRTSDDQFRNCKSSDSRGLIFLKFNNQMETLTTSFF